MSEADIIAYHKMGYYIEFKPKFAEDVDWMITLNPCWNFVSFEYRVMK